MNAGQILLSKLHTYPMMNLLWFITAWAADNAIAWLGLLRAAIIADGLLELWPLSVDSDPLLVWLSLLVIVIWGTGWSRNEVVSCVLHCGDGGGLQKAKWIKIIGKSFFFTLFWESKIGFGTFHIKELFKETNHFQKCTKEGWALSPILRFKKK